MGVHAVVVGSKALAKPSVAGARAASMSRGVERRKAFRWRASHHGIPIKELVASGFFVPDVHPQGGEADVVVCFHCGLRLDSWVRGDPVQRDLVAAAHSHCMCGIWGSGGRVPSRSHGTWV